MRCAYRKRIVDFLFTVLVDLFSFFVIVVGFSQAHSLSFSFVYYLASTTKQIDARFRVKSNWKSKTLCVQHMCVCQVYVVKVQ